MKTTDSEQKGKHLALSKRMVQLHEQRSYTFDFKPENTTDKDAIEDGLICTYSIKTYL